MLPPLVTNLSNAFPRGADGFRRQTDISVDEARGQFDTNFFGVVWMVHAVLPLMRQQKRGHIISVSSLDRSQWHDWTLLCPTQSEAGASICDC